MLNVNTLAKIQNERHARMGSGNYQGSDVRSKDWVTADCRKYIRDSSVSIRYLDSEDKRTKTLELITEYVQNNNPRVDGLLDQDNNADVAKVIDMLVQAITDYDILTNPIRDESVFEIRSNGKEIKIEKDRKQQDLLDDDGNIVSWDTREQQETVLRKLLGDARLNPKYALVSARTDEGFRIAAVHYTATSPDPLDPTGERFNNFVLRKFKQDKLGLNDIVRYGTLSDDMAVALSLLAPGGCSFATIGPTSSGKTTSNNAILQTVPKDTRTVLLQNPSEIDLRFRDPITGRVTNDVIHLEAREIEDPSPYDPTMANLMDHTLRLTPTFVCFGELRTDKEFSLALKIGRAGHPYNCTFHADDSEGAVGRFVEAIVASSGNMTYELAVAAFVQITNFIIVQKIMRDGSRKVLQITEVVGIDKDNPSKALLNDLYNFEIIGDPIYNEDGSVHEIRGIHKRVGKLSKRTHDKLKLEGVKVSLFDFLNKDVDPDNEIQTYTGDKLLGLS